MSAVKYHNPFSKFFLNYSNFRFVVVQYFLILFLCRCLELHLILKWRRTANVHKCVWLLSLCNEIFLLHFSKKYLKFPHNACSFVHFFSKRTAFLRANHTKTSVMMPNVHELVQKRERQWTCLFGETFSHSFTIKIHRESFHETLTRPPGKSEHIYCLTFRFAIC